MKMHEEETDDVYLLRCLPKKTIGLDIFWLIVWLKIDLEKRKQKISNNEQNTSLEEKQGCLMKRMCDTH